MNFLILSLAAQQNHLFVSVNYQQGLETIGSIWVTLLRVLKKLGLGQVYKYQV